MEFHWWWYKTSEKPENSCVLGKFGKNPPSVAGSGEQGAGSRERGAGSGEQGAGSRERGAGSRERGARCGTFPYRAASIDRGMLPVLPSIQVSPPKKPIRQGTHR